MNKRINRNKIGDYLRLRSNFYWCFYLKVIVEINFKHVIRKLENLDETDRSKFYLILN